MATNNNNKNNIDNKLCGYIYMLDHICAYIAESRRYRKIGTTREYSQRLNCLCTAHLIAPYYLRVYKVNCDSTQLEKRIHKYFDQYRYKAEDMAGTEFFDEKVTPEILEEYFNNNGVEYEIEMASKLVH